MSDKRSTLGEFSVLTDPLRNRAQAWRTKVAGLREHGARHMPIAYELRAVQSKRLADFHPFETPRNSSALGGWAQ